MAKRRWTVVFVPHNAEPSKIVEVSFGIVKLAASVAAVVGVAMLLAGYAALARTTEATHTTRLEKENRRLQEQLGDLNSRLLTLADTLSVIGQRDAKFRILANLEPIDPEVRAVGIGGPVGTPRLAPEGSSEAVMRAEDIRLDLNALIRRANLLASSFQEATDSLATHTARLAATPSIMPTQGWLSSAFSAMRSHPVLHVARPHEGIDVSAPMDSPIEAPADGKVIDAGWEPGYGHMITIDHGYGTVTKFAHCSKLLVRRGQRVTRGQRIALVGNSGLATGPHLHYEVHVNGRPVNPLRYVLPEHAVAD